MVTGTAGSELIPKRCKAIKPLSQRLVCALARKGHMCSQVFGMVFDWDANTAELPSNQRTGGPTKSFLLVYRQIRK
jgi:hypothetical protein